MNLGFTVKYSRYDVCSSCQICRSSWIVYNVIIANFLLNLDVRASQGGQDEAAIHCEFHVAGPRCFIAYCAAPNKDQKHIWQMLALGFYW